MFQKVGHEWKHAKYFSILILPIYLLFFSPLCDSATVDDDLSLTLSQKVALDKFRKSVSDKLPHDYMKQDVYLIRWLRARNFDTEQAEAFLLKNLKWREDKRMDEILKEDWADMENDYPYNLDSRDKEGKPVLFGEFGHWDLRHAEVTGRFDRLIRFGERIMEEEETLVRKLQGEGKPVTRTIIILDMDGFNLVQHMCSRCMSYILTFYSSFEEHYPSLIDKLFIINNHPLLNTVLQSFLSNFAPNTRAITKLYSRNKAEYSKALLEYIDQDQLPERYGGTKRFA